MNVEQRKFPVAKATSKLLDFNNHIKQNQSEPSLQRNRIEILGALVDDILLDEALVKIEGWVTQRQQEPSFPIHHVVTLNPEYVTLAQKDAGLLDIINRASMVTPDGVGLLYASKAMLKPLRGRVTGVQITEELAKRSADMSNQGEGELRLFLLGAAEGVAEKAAANLRKCYPGVQIVGTFAGQASVEGDAETIAKVREARADVVLVAFGMGKQDRWIVRNLQETGASVGIGVGGTFDYFAGVVACPPLAVKKLGIEWAYRIVSQKGRWRRAHYVPRFIGAVALRSPLYWLPSES